MDAMKKFSLIKNFASVGSTLTEAYQLLKESSTRGDFILTAEMQYDGKGRKGNFWASPKGGLWLTAGMRNLDTPSGFTLFLGYCIHKTLTKIYDCQFQIKWPNDIYLHQKKIGGIIVNHYPSQNCHLLGLGINTNVEALPVELAAKATSLFIETGVSVDNQQIMDVFFSHVYAELPNFIAHGLSDYLPYLDEFSYLLGKKVHITNPGNYSGKAVGIDQDGSLLLEIAVDYIVSVLAGTVEIIS